MVGIVTDSNNIKEYVRAANYLTAAQIFLQDNFLLDRPLTFEDIKPRLLGHWGTCPGINLIYACLNRLIKQSQTEVLFVMGPGHGFAALQANLFIEGTLEHFYPAASQTAAGVGYILKNFSWPYGFPSHSSPATPGVIVEGGELGYALATAYGAALDNPDLIVACVVGDGEAETGPTAAAWHLNKLLDPKTGGAVLPILHLNGYKISGPTVFGRMSDDELRALFTGYGYNPLIVSFSEAIYEEMEKTLSSASEQIKAIQQRARSGHANERPAWPLIILQTPKGWTGIKELDGEKIEGNCLSHQVVLKEAKSDAKQLSALEEWLRSYNFSELFDPRAGFTDNIKKILPPEHLRMGMSKHALGGPKVYHHLQLPDINRFTEDASEPGTMGSSSMRRCGLYLKDVFIHNEKQANFRFFSPDETYSNKLDMIFQATNRAWQWPIVQNDKDLGQQGRVMEMLSEHSLQGLMQGYVLTGRQAVFASYEAFIQIVCSMVDQYAKFLKVARQTKWRHDIPSLNYILTSSGWRQEHNGFSHQNPGFIDDLLQRQNQFTNIYLPPDGNSSLVCLDRCLSSKNSINVIVAGKTFEPRWLTAELAKEELKRGLMIWDFASDHDPDIVLAAAGDYVTTEIMAAIDIVKSENAKIRMRCVNVMAMSGLGFGNPVCPMPGYEFYDYFTTDKPVIFNFHGYPQTIKQALFDEAESCQRFHIHGYEEEGSTTTPFDMQVRNKTDRYNLAIEVFTILGQEKVISQKSARVLQKKYEAKLANHKIYIKRWGIDPPEITDWQWKKHTY